LDNFFFLFCHLYLMLWKTKKKQNHSHKRVFFETLTKESSFHTNNTRVYPKQNHLFLDLFLSHAKAFLFWVFYSNESFFIHCIRDLKKETKKKKRNLGMYEIWMIHAIPLFFFFVFFFIF
jgi:hypothetical protein